MRTALHSARLLVAAMRMAGDAPGHEFHGNQYTGSIGDIAKQVDVTNGPVAVGPISTVVHRVGATTEGEVYFAGTHEDAKAYASLHEGHEVKAYPVVTKNTLVATGHHQLYSHLNPGKNFNDAVYKAEKKYFKSTGGRGNSIAAFRDAQRTMMNQARAKGYDSILFKAPPAPAKEELVLLKPKLHNLGAFLDNAQVVVQGRKGEGPVHAAADAHRAKVSVAVRYAFAVGRRAVDKAALKSAVASGAKGRIVDAAMPAVDATKAALAKVLPKALHAALADGGHAGAKILGPRLRAAEEFRTLKGGKKVGPVAFSFDQSNPAAVDWANKHAAELIDGISETTRQRIGDAVTSALEDGDLEDLYDKILSEVGDEDRADLIARTETMTAANEGQRQSWDQATEAGLLTGDEKRVWIATDDERVCPICDELDGETTDLDGEYPGDGGDGPPAHPDCRCTEGIAS